MPNHAMPNHGSIRVSMLVSGVLSASLPLLAQEDPQNVVIRAYRDTRTARPWPRAGACACSRPCAPPPPARAGAA
eukprot:968434-Pyramimonas_sp.AAC.1